MVFANVLLMSDLGEQALKSAFLASGFFQVNFKREFEDRDLGGSRTCPSSQTARFLANVLYLKEFCVY